MNFDKLRLFIIVACLSLLFGCGGGSSGGDTPEPDPEIVLDPTTYIALGCGITEGSGAGQTKAWPEFLQNHMLEDITVVNLGNSRTYAVYGSYHIEEYILEYTPGCVLVLYGVNDIAADVDNDEILFDLEEIVQVAQYYGCDIILGTLPDVPVYSDDESSRLIGLNEGIVELCTDYGISCAHVSAAINDDSFYRSDGFHTTDGGSWQIANVYYGVLQQMYNY